MQNVIANAVLKEATGKPRASISLFTVPMQSQNLEVDKFTAFNSVFANMTLLLYVLPVFNMVFYIVKEKE